LPAPLVVGVTVTAPRRVTTAPTPVVNDDAPGNAANCADVIAAVTSTGTDPPAGTVIELALGVSVASTGCVTVMLYVIGDEPVFVTENVFTALQAAVPGTYPYESESRPSAVHATEFVSVALSTRRKPDPLIRPL
jgi:hypothetical protein